MQWSLYIRTTQKNFVEWKHKWDGKNSNSFPYILIKDKITIFTEKYVHMLTESCVATELSVILCDFVTESYVPFILDTTLIENFVAESYVRTAHTSV